MLRVGLVLLIFVGGALAVALLRPGKNNALAEGSVVIRGERFTVEIAETSLERIRGLSYRERLEPNHGMLFVHADAAVRQFWMKGMQFPIDIIWIHGETVVGIEKNAPVPKGAAVPRFSSPEPIDLVLEVSAGTADRIGIAIGDAVTVEFPQP